MKYMDSLKIRFLPKLLISLVSLLLSFNVNAISVSDAFINIDSHLADTILLSFEDTTLSATSGSITDSAQLTTNYSLTLNASHDIVLDQLDVLGYINATANNVSLVNSGNMIIGDLTARRATLSANDTVWLNGHLNILLENSLGNNIYFESSNAYLNGTLELSLSDPSTFSVGDSINIFSSTGSINYNFTDIILPELGNGLTLNTDSLFVDGTLTVTSIPVPAAVWLFSSGLIGLVGFARRNKL